MRKPFFWAARKGWYLRVPGEDGKLDTIRLGDTKQDAYNEWDRRKIEAAAPPPPPTPIESPLVSELIDQFIAHIRSEAKLGKIKSTTVDRRIAHLAPFLAVSAGLSIDDLKPHHITSWLQAQHTWNATTRSDAAAVVKQAIKWAADQGRIPASPIDRIKVSRGEPRDHVISDAEYESILAAVWQQKFARRLVTSFRVVLIALRLSGCRPGEIARLKVEDFDGSTWTIREHKNKKKKRKPRVIYLCPCLVTLTRVAARGRESGPLFLAGDGRGWKYSDMRLRFQRLRAKAKASPECVLYSFRHTWITNALLAGVDVATVAEMAGTSIQMIDRVYGHLSQHKSHMIDAALKIRAARGK